MANDECKNALTTALQIYIDAGGVHAWKFILNTYLSVIVQNLLWLTVMNRQCCLMNMEH